MPNHSGFRQNRKPQKPKEKPTIDENNPVLKAFKSYAAELDDKHDRYERIVKLSRDITIESKRIIFSLHSIDSRKGNKEKVLEEAQQRLEKLIENNFKAVAKELKDQDPYHYRGAYSPGLQEFIEAYTFMEYMKYADEAQANGNNVEKSVSDWIDLQKQMHYTDLQQSEENEKVDNEENGQKGYSFFVDPTEYILGVSDLTGELMRRCINSLGSGETDTCLSTCKVLQQFYTGYISLNVHRCRELSRKIYTMRQSVLKSENVCYNVKVRGGEAAKWGSVFDNKPGDDIDEGFY
ncbi:translin-associated protein X [Lucilia cuprina]|uniref:translin-associated protein X n=1 Tax=Lucilia cuprina TaxID=7375 RepID=UPI001F054C43|nr:translin-associated protein X [Lucilia cuprina]